MLMMNTLTDQKSKSLSWCREIADFFEGFRQNFDLSLKEMKIRFAGEADADVGGPFKEFLALCMK